MRSKSFRDAMTDSTQPFGVYPFEIAAVEALFIEIGDLESFAEAFKTVRFSRDVDACLYRLAFKTCRLTAKEWTIQNGEDAVNWIEEHASDSPTISEWCYVIFCSAESKALFDDAIRRSHPNCEDVWTGQPIQT